MSVFPTRVPWQGAAREPMGGDASARQYVRLRAPDGQSAVLMQDADAANVQRFLRVGAHLDALGLSVPRVIESGDAAGLILLEDFGDATVSLLLREAPRQAREAYGVAADLLLFLDGQPVPDWAARDGDAPLAAMIDVTLDRVPARTDLRARLQDVLDTQRMGREALSLRDYHADNLIWLPGRDGLRRVGLLDYQDAVALPRGYDLASLVDDPRREVPVEWRDALIRGFAAHTGMNEAQAHTRVNALSVLRNLRILGIFRRLATEHGKPHYARFLPRTLALVERCVAEDPALAPLAPDMSDLAAMVRGWCP